MRNPSECRTCSSDIPNLAYKCNYCGSTYCKEHRLPEAHDCLGLKTATESEQKWGFGLLEDDKDIQESVDVEDAVKRLEEMRSSEPAISTDHSTKANDPTVHERVDQVIGMLNLDEKESGNVDNDSKEPYDTVDPTVYSSSPEPDYDSSPDVNPDGSVARSESASGDLATRSHRPNSNIVSGYKIAIIAMVLVGILLILGLYLS